MRKGFSLNFNGEATAATRPILARSPQTNRQMYSPEEIKFLRPPTSKLYESTPNLSFFLSFVFLASPSDFPLHSFRNRANPNKFLDISLARSSANFLIRFAKGTFLSKASISSDRNARCILAGIEKVSFFCRDAKWREIQERFNRAWFLAQRERISPINYRRETIGTHDPLGNARTWRGGNGCWLEVRRELCS